MSDPTESGRYDEFLTYLFTSSKSMFNKTDRSSNLLVQIQNLAETKSLFQKFEQAMKEDGKIKTPKEKKLFWNSVWNYKARRSKRAEQRRLLAQYLKFLVLHFGDQVDEMKKLQLWLDVLKENGDPTAAATPPTPAEYHDSPEERSSGEEYLSGSDGIPAEFEDLSTPFSGAPEKKLLSHTGRRRRSSQTKKRHREPQNPNSEITPPPGASTRATDALSRKILWGSTPEGKRTTYQPESGAGAPSSFSIIGSSASSSSFTSSVGGEIKALPTQIVPQNVGPAERSAMESTNLDTIPAILGDVLPEVNPKALYKPGTGNVPAPGPLPFSSSIQPAQLKEAIRSGREDSARPDVPSLKTTLPELKSELPQMERKQDIRGELARAFQNLRGYYSKGWVLFPHDRVRLMALSDYFHAGGRLTGQPSPQLQTMASEARSRLGLDAKYLPPEKSAYQMINNLSLGTRQQILGYIAEQSLEMKDHKSKATDEIKRFAHSLQPYENRTDALNTRRVMSALGNNLRENKNRAGEFMSPTLIEQQRFLSGPVFNPYNLHLPGVAPLPDLSQLSENVRTTLFELVKTFLKAGTAAGLGAGGAALIAAAKAGALGPWAAAAGWGLEFGAASLAAINLFDHVITSNTVSGGSDPRPSPAQPPNSRNLNPIAGQNIGTAPNPGGPAAPFSSPDPDAGLAVTPDSNPTANLEGTPYASPYNSPDRRNLSYSDKKDLDNIIAEQLRLEREIKRGRPIRFHPLGNPVLRNPVAPPPGSDGRDLVTSVLALGGTVAGVVAADTIARSGPQPPGGPGGPGVGEVKADDPDEWIANAQDDDEPAPGEEELKKYREPYKKAIQPELKDDSVDVHQTEGKKEDKREETKSRVWTPSVSPTPVHEWREDTDAFRKFRNDEYQAVKFRNNIKRSKRNDESEEGPLSQIGNWFRNIASKNEELADDNTLRDLFLKKNKDYKYENGKYYQNRLRAVENRGIPVAEPKVSPSVQSGIKPVEQTKSRVWTPTPVSSEEETEKPSARSPQSQTQPVAPESDRVLKRKRLEDSQLTGISQQDPQSKSQLLRSSFFEGGAGIVDGVNKDAKLNLINEMVWQSFKNYNWEVNEQPDNPLNTGVVIEEGVRFGGALLGEEYLASQQRDANESIHSGDADVTAADQPDSILDAAGDIFMAVVPYEGQAAMGDGVQTFTKSSEMQMNEFHDVFVPDWFSIAENSPLETFTASAGTQYPDSSRLREGELSDYNWEKVGMENQWIFDTAS